MSYYIYEKPRQRDKAWIKIVTGVMLVTSLLTGFGVTHRFSSKIASLEKTIDTMKEKEIYYKDIEDQFFEKKSEALVIPKYEEELSKKEVEKQQEIGLKEQEITTLSDYITELANQSAALENTIRKQASVSPVKPQNYNLPEILSRGTYDRARRDDTVIIENKMEYVGDWLMTMYAPTAEECSNNKGITASGLPVQPGQNIAIDPRYWSFGQKFYIEGYGEVVATDTGSAIKGRNRLDYCVLDPKLAKEFGSKKVKVWLIK